MITLSRETEDLAARVAAEKRLPVDAAIREALQAWGGADLSAEQPPIELRAEKKRRFKQIVDEISRLPVLDSRSTHDIADDLDSL